MNSVAETIPLIPQAFPHIPYPVNAFLYEGKYIYLLYEENPGSLVALDLSLELNFLSRSHFFKLSYRTSDP